MHPIPLLSFPAPRVIFPLSALLVDLVLEPARLGQAEHVCPSMDEICFRVNHDTDWISEPALGGRLFFDL